MFFADRFTLSQSLPPMRSAKYLRTFFFRICLPFFREILSTSMFFCCSIYTKTAQNSREESNEFADLCFEDYHYVFQQTLCPVTLAHYRSLYFIQVYIFIPLINSAPFFPAFHTSYFTPIFFLCIFTRKYHAKYFSHPCWHCCSEFNYYFWFHAVEGLIWTVFFFLTYIALIQWNFPWNKTANLLRFTNKASSHVVIV